jgi:hypothetical protein
MYHGCLYPILRTLLWSRELERQLVGIGFRRSPPRDPQALPRRTWHVRRPNLEKAMPRRLFLLFVDWTAIGAPQQPNG